MLAGVDPTEAASFSTAAEAVEGADDPGSTSEVDAQLKRLVADRALSRTNAPPALIVGVCAG